MDKLTIKGKTYDLPIYLPDATRAVTKGLDSQDLIDSKVRGAVVNTYHLMTTPGTKVLRKAGGIKEFMNYDGLITSDSGGWQVFSLIHRNKRPGKITDEGVRFMIGESKKLFTPEISIKTQLDIGSDIIVCLDDFTPPDASEKKAKETVERTIKWAKESKKVFEREVKKRKLTKKTRPHLLAVVQGGYFKELRKNCAEELIKIGFDGYGYGGYVIDDDGNLDLELSQYIANLLPNDKFKFALGFGRPIDIVRLAEMGWDIFDCTLPTRDARHMRLYNFKKEPKSPKDLNDSKNFSYVYINKAKYENDFGPISKFCDCMVCENYSRSYLRHLFKIKDFSAFRLASIHNLRMYTKLTEYIMNL